MYTNTINQMQVILCHLIPLSLCNCQYLHVFISLVTKTFFLQEPIAKT